MSGHRLRMFAGATVFQVGRDAGGAHRVVADLGFYQAATKDAAPGKDPAVGISAALGFARTMLDRNGPQNVAVARTYAQIGHNLAYTNGIPNLAALSSTYLYKIESLSHPSSSLAQRYGQEAFVQSPAPVYAVIPPSKQADLFKNYRGISPLGWRAYVGVIQNDLERKLVGVRGST
jgi:hypothetical protein